MDCHLPRHEQTKKFKEMKKLRLLMMLASAAVLMVGCEKENTSRYNGGSSNQQTTTYTVNVSGIQVPSGMAIEILAVEYSASNERLQINRFNLTSSSMTKKYTANSRTEKVKIAFNASNPSTGQSASLWIQQVFYLNKGTNTVISITGSSPTGPTEP